MIETDLIAEATLLAREYAHKAFAARHDCDDLVDRTISVVWELAHNAGDNATPRSIAIYAIKRVKSNRDYRESVRSITHPKHFRRRVSDTPLRERLEENPAFIFQVTDDFREFLATLTVSQRTIARLYLTGYRTSEIAKRMRVTAGAVSQTRKRLLTLWREFTGQE